MLAVLHHLIGLQVDSRIVSVYALESCVVALVYTGRSASCLHSFGRIFDCRMSIDADCDMIAGRTNEVCILALSLFVHEVIGCSDVIMAIGFYALNCVVSIETKLL